MDEDIISKEMATKIINSTFNMLMPEDVGKPPLGQLNVPMAKAGA